MRTLDELGISPAPWEVRDCIDECGEVCGKWLVDADGNDLITDLDGDGLNGITANARLIAAAPMLCEVAAWCKEQADAIGASCISGRVNPFTLANCMDGIVRRCEAALAKASGEEVAFKQPRLFDMPTDKQRKKGNHK